MKQNGVKSGVLVKASHPYLMENSLKSIDMVKNTNFQELVFKKTGKTFLKESRTITKPDVFTELNNFHQFLNEEEIE